VGFGELLLESEGLDSKTKKGQGHLTANQVNTGLKFTPSTIE
jgi:hypothetical protein